MHRILKFWCPLIFASWTLPAMLCAETVKVNFEEVSQTARESETLVLNFELSEENFFEAEVAWAINPNSTAVEGEDFRILPPDGADEVENPLIFTPGLASRTLQIALISDAIEEGTTPETIIIDILSEGTTIVEPGSIATHTIEIVDASDFSVRFSEFIQKVDESGSFEIPINLSAETANDIEIFYTLESGSASIDDDLNVNSSESSSSPLTLSGTGGFVVLSLAVEDDNIVEAAEEEFTIRLDSANVIGEETNVAVDSREFVGIIEDNDPLEVNFQPIDFTFSTEASAGETLELEVVLSDIANEAVQIPFRLSGDADRGGPQTGDFDIPIGDVEIAAGEDTGTLPIIVLQDNASGDFPKELTLTLENPTTESGTTLQVGEFNQFEVTLAEGEGGPNTLNFGRLVQEGTASSPPEFASATQRIVGESDLSYRLPVFFKRPLSQEATFQVEIVGSEGTASPVDRFRSLNLQVWDYRANFRGSFLGEDDPGEITFPAGTQFDFINFEFFNDEEPVLKLGEETTDAFEEDETVVIKISEVSTEEAGVQLGEASEFTLTIRDFPTIDISALVQSMKPSEAVSKNPISGLFEVPYTFELAEPLDPQEFAGYRSLRFEFSTATVDQENPNIENRITVPENPASFGEPFDYVFPNTYRLAYISTLENEVLIPGEEQPLGTPFREEFADTVVRYDIIRQRVNLPPINSEDLAPTDFVDLDESIDLLFEFTNAGRTSFDTSVIDPGTNPESFRITLSRQADPQKSELTSNDFFINPKRVFQDANGNTVININLTSFNAGEGLQIDYWDGEGDWVTTNPALIELQGSELFWIDTGPPKTAAPSGSIPMRFYRIIRK